MPIKLATVVPEDSIWDKSLKQMAADWKQATGDRVAVTVFSGGSQGDETSVLRKMRLDALQAASLTVVGLATIDPAFNVFNVPFFFDSYDELNAVVEQADADAEAARRSQGLRAPQLGPRRVAAGLHEASGPDRGRSQGPRSSTRRPATIG